MVINKLFLIISLILYCGSSKAQQSSIYPLLSMEVKATSLGNDTTADGLFISTDSLWFNAHMYITLFDTIGISKLHVKFGRTPGNYDLLQTDFAYDVSGALSANISYLRDRYTIDLGLGNYQGILSFYSEVIIEKNDGSLTDAALFNH